MPILGLKAPGPSAPAHFDLEPLIRPNILALQPYRCARDDYSAGVLLDANENAIGPSLPRLSSTLASDDASKVAAETLSLLSEAEIANLNRYPSPTHDDLKREIAKLRGVPDENWVFLGVGSDEVIDMLYRVLCVPGKDRVMTCPPTYGMYKVTANVNDVGVLEVPLITEDGSFQLDEPALDAAFESNPDVKMLFVCSPGNPTGTLIPLPAIQKILDNPKFKGVVVVDEAYIDFSPQGSSAASLVNEYANVCVTQTLSKSFGLAAIRLGYLLAPPPLIQILTNTKAPYNVSVPTASIALKAVSTEGAAAMSCAVATLNDNRQSLIDALSSTKGIGRILGGNHANFVLAEILGENGKPSNQKALEVYKTMAESKGVVVRFRGTEKGCEGCLRITVGTAKECEEAVQSIASLL
ncbi:histidinol-phosphate transaminase [Cryptococcus amylolentus CBS 6273]|uniref:histidinol-phosphate transaminase n=1 Tax=Cryptococcus amylolentus CBS 6273 TaxID=1296118 RepID=A0A1E3KD16_9TREE|nr:histidinol-phosphate transaminase [Cryptococcus amylolentus CBS 6273]